MAEVAQEVARRMHTAADELEAAASAIPNCDCKDLNADEMSTVVGDLMRARAAADTVHACLRSLQCKHGGARVGRATLETQPLDGLPSSLKTPSKQAAESIAQLVGDAANELTGGQCC
ncbi:hypothetical protein ABPG77_005113 [Micractinium sp. CCAP 211/92]